MAEVALGAQPPKSESTAPDSATLFLASGVLIASLAGTTGWLCAQAATGMLVKLNNNTDILNLRMTSSFPMSETVCGQP